MFRPFHKEIYKTEYFEKIYKKFYSDVFCHLNNINVTDNGLHPPENDRNEIIKNALNEECAFRFIDHSDRNLIVPLAKDDTKFIFEKVNMTNKHFFKYIHPAYLVPYFLYIGFVFQILREKKMDRADLLKLRFHFPLPLKMPKNSTISKFNLPSDKYAWYIQHGRILSLNENNQIISHISTFHCDRQFFVPENIESRILEASILINATFSEKFQKILTQAEKNYFINSVFTDKEKSFLNSFILNPTNGLTKKRFSDLEEKKYDLRKSILNKLYLHKGGKLDIDTVIAYLKKIDVLPFQ